MTIGFFVAVLAAGLVAQTAPPISEPTPIVQEPAAPKPAPWPPAGVVRLGVGIEAPKLLRGVKPNYTADAIRTKVQGVVELEAVVLTDGTVGDVIVTRSLDKENGLDRQAIQALKQWCFKPATKDGTVIPVVVSVEMTFTIRDKR